jgi:Uma2 family endonuclease
MAAPVASPGNRAGIPALALRRFSAAEYDRILRSGLIPPDTAVELFDGLVIRREPVGPAGQVLVLSAPEDQASPYPPLPVYKFSVEDYHRLIDVGVLQEGEPVELLDGWLVKKMTRNPPHDLALSLAEHEIDRRLPTPWFRRVQSAVTTTGSEPEPDLAVVRGPRRRYAKHHPGPADMALVVEVAESSLGHDRNFKGPLYARASIPVYWIINLVDARVEVYTDPTGPDPNPRYRQRQDYGPAEEVPLVLDGVEVGRIPVRDL